MTHNNSDLPANGLERRNYIVGTAGLVAGTAFSTAAAAVPLTLLPKDYSAAKPMIKSETAQDWFEAVPGERMRVRIGSGDTGGALSVLESIVAPKAATPLHYHVADEMFLVMSGRLRLVCNGKGEDLFGGSSAVVPGGAHHGFVNLSSEPVRMLAIFSPGGMEQLFIQLQTTPPEKWGDLASCFDTFIIGPPLTG